MKADDKAPKKVGAVEKTTSASYFRKRKDKEAIGEPITVGEVTFMVGRPSLSNLTKQGLIPSELAASAVNIQNKVSGKSNLSGKDLENYQKYERLMVINSVRSPNIVDDRDADYDNNEIHIDDLSDEEISELTMYIQGGMTALRTFRAGRQRQIAGFSS